MERPRHPLIRHSLWKIRHLIFGSFIGAYRARRGLGSAKSRAEWEQGYGDGAWDYLEGPEERSRYMVILGYVAGLDQGRTVLDVGCGTGGLLELGQNFHLSGYHGLDTSEVAIAKARKRFRRSRPSFEFSFEVADFESFATERRFDAIVFNESLSYARDPIVVLDRFAPLLAPEGVFLISLCYTWWQEPMIERIVAIYPVMHSSDVINEQHLMWRVRMLQGQRRAGADTGRGQSSASLMQIRAELAEKRVMLAENVGAIMMLIPALLSRRRSRAEDDERKS